MKSNTETLQKSEDLQESEAVHESGKSEKLEKLKK